MDLNRLSMLQQMRCVYLRDLIGMSRKNLSGIWKTSFERFTWRDVFAASHGTQCEEVKDRPNGQALHKPPAG
jgi:hypothetical protein